MFLYLNVADISGLVMFYDDFLIVMRVGMLLFLTFTFYDFL